VDKNCTSPTDCNGAIDYTLHIENPGLTKLTCTVTETGPAVDWQPANAETPAFNTTLELAPGKKFDYAGQYTTDPGTSGIINTIKLDCIDECQQAIAKEDSADCSIPPCQEEICRTPGFWATHPNVTQCVMNAGQGLFVCGKVIDNTKDNCSDSATEAMCVAVKGEPVRQLARQLTAAALNCIMSNGSADCTGVASVAQIFADCNDICADSGASQGDITECIGMIDAFNNGLLSDCHERALCNKDEGLCFDPPGPADPSACQAAKKTDCGVVGSSICANSCAPATPTCPSCGDSLCGDSVGESKFPMFSKIMSVLSRFNPF
jgi:hypothetical protein